MRIFPGFKHQVRCAWGEGPHALNPNAMNLMPAGDFPEPRRYAEILRSYDLTVFPRLDKSALAAIDGALSIDIPNLMATFDNPYA